MIEKNNENKKTTKEILVDKKSEAFSKAVSVPVKSPIVTIQTNMQQDTSTNKNIEIPRIIRLRNSIDKVFLLSPHEILLNENVRNEINESSSEFIALKNSIAEEGVLQPVAVELRELENDEYTLVAINGHRRILASQKLNLEKIMCVIKKYSDKDSRLLHGLTENLLREDLEPLDIAEGYSNLVNLGWSASDIAEYFGKNTNYVYGIIRLAAYAPKLKEIIRKHKDKFPMRVLINEFSKKSWKSEDALLSAVLGKIEKNKERVPSSKTKFENNTKKLQEFFESNPPISDEIKNYVIEAFMYCNLVST